MTKNLHINILLATCNGEKYIKEQIESLLTQTYQDWKLLVRDDESTDRTKEIVYDYQKKYPEKIRIIEDNKGNLGPGPNFGVLLKHSDAAYTMFCDQDDVWLPQKIELTSAQMQEMEKRHGSDKPLLVFTNTKIVDGNLTPIDNSFWNYFGKNPQHTAFNYLLMDNVAPGCTFMMNDKLKEISSNLPSDNVLHDWWTAMHASLFGFISHVNIPTMLYRIHEKNYATRILGKGVGGTVKKTFGLSEAYLRSRASIEKRQRRAAVFYSAYENSAHRNADWLQLIKGFSELDKTNIFRRKYFLLKNKLFCGTPLKTIKEILLY